MSNEVKLIREMIDKARNVKSVKIIIPNERILQRINSTPTLKRLTRSILKVGENFENVNHQQYSDLLRMYPLLGVTIEEV